MRPGARWRRRDRRRRRKGSQRAGAKPRPRGMEGRACGLPGSTTWGSQLKVFPQAGCGSTARLSRGRSLLSLAVLVRLRVLVPDLVLALALGRGHAAHGDLALRGGGLAALLGLDFD